MASPSKPNSDRMTDLDIERMQKAAENREAALIKMRRQREVGDLFVRMRDAAAWAGDNMGGSATKAGRAAAEQYQLLAFEAYQRAHDAARDAGLLR